MKHLVVFAPNWLGDAVMALPALADVRRGSPHTEITVAARPSIAPLFSMVPEVDRSLVIDARRSLRDAGSELASQGFDTALLLPNSTRAALVVSLARIPERWGYRANFRAPLLTRAIARPSGLHQAEYYQQLVHALGFPNGPMEPRITVPPGVRAAAAAMLRDVGWDGAAPMVAVSPGAAYGAAKRWPAERFAELAASLAADDVQSVVIGTEADAPTAAEVSRAFHAIRRRTTAPAVHGSAGADEARGVANEAGRAVAHDLGAGYRPILSLVGRTDLPMLAGVLATCRALVTNDSGSMHLAAAVGTSVTAVFGPTDERATRPLGDAHRVLTFPVWCRPCLLRECPLDHRCMRGVDAAAVVAAARRSL